jgi:hypothetical protein
MIFDSSVVVLVLSVIGVGIIVGILSRYFSEEARIERRRRRSNYRIVKKAKGPSVTLSVRTKKD